MGALSEIYLEPRDREEPPEPSLSQNLFWNKEEAEAASISAPALSEEKDSSLVNAKNADSEQMEQADEAKHQEECEAEKLAKKEEELAALQRIAAMEDSDVTKASMERIATDTERLTHRNMKICVMQDIQGKCQRDPVLARLVLDPRKSMINCFRYINRQAHDFIKQEMRDNHEKTENGIYGGDVPDDLCYAWAEHYFRDPDAPEDKKKEEKHISKPSNANPKKKKEVPAKQEQKTSSHVPVQPIKKEPPQFEQMSFAM